MITVLAGGVGAARFLSGLIQVVDAKEITVVVNTADDFVLHGLSICPDLDSIRYTLSCDTGDLGWGRANESWTAMAELAKISAQAPENSRATDWFALGDRDLSTHLYRTQRLREGADLTQVTRELCAASGVEIELLPMTNDHVATMLTLDNGEIVDFQEYFVKLKHSVPVSEVTFDGAANAKASRHALDAIANAQRVIIAPSNPIVSIGPLLALPELESVVRAQRHNTVAITPIIGGKAVKGPADRLLTELGFESSIDGVATYLSDYVDHLVADVVDQEMTVGGMDVSYTNTLMSSPDHAKALAEFVLAI